jgi:hypothetical protein
VLYTTIGQSILLKTAFPAEIDVDTPIHSAEVDVDTPILMWLPRWWFCIRTLLSPLISGPIQPIYAIKTMDIGLPTSSPSGVNFMPSSPPPAPNGVQPWADSNDLNHEFIDMVLKNKANCLLTPLKRSDYQYYLNNRDAKSQATDRAHRRRQAYDKHWALTFFELQDNQVYRKTEQRKDGTWIKARYAACTYDAMELIQKVHCNLHHASEYNANLYANLY